MKTLICGLVAGCLMLVSASTASALPVTYTVMGSVAVNAGENTSVVALPSDGTPGTLSVSATGFSPGQDFAVSIVDATLSPSGSTSSPGVRTKMFSVTDLVAATLGGTFDLGFFAFGPTPPSGPIDYTAVLSYEAVDVPPSPVPEPTSLALLGIGSLVGGVVVMRRRRVSLVA